MLRANYQRHQLLSNATLGQLTPLQLLGGDNVRTRWHPSILVKLHDLLPLTPALQPVVSGNRLVRRCKFKQLWQFGRFWQIVERLGGFQRSAGKSTVNAIVAKAVIRRSFIETVLLLVQGGCSIADPYR